MWTLNTTLRVRCWRTLWPSRYKENCLPSSRNRLWERNRYTMESRSWWMQYWNDWEWESCSQYVNSRSVLDILPSHGWRNIVKYWILQLYIEIHVYEGNELTVELVLSIYGSVGGLITQNWSEFSWGSTMCQNTLTSAQRYSVLIGRSPIQRYSCVRLGTKPTEGRNEKQHVYPFCARNFESEKSLFGSLLRDN